MEGARIFAFGAFRFVPERQLLMRGEETVRIGSRALDLLVALVERPGELVTKAELMSRAWPTTTVAEGNLKVNMAVLRRALADDAAAARYIATVSGRGYRFVAPVRTNNPAGCCACPPVDARTAFGEAPDAKTLNGKEVDTPESPTMIERFDPRPRIRFVDFPPERSGASSRYREPPDAIDYGIVIDGEVTLLLDGTSVQLKPGSLVVRCGVDHGWTNLSDKPARMLFVELASPADAGMGEASVAR